MPTDSSQEFIRLLAQMPDNGLILDVRGNGGGNIWAAERLLQTLTPSRSSRSACSSSSRRHARSLPQQSGELARFRSTSGALRSRRRSRPASIYSHAFPLTTEGELQRDRPAVLRSRRADRRRQLLFGDRHLRGRLPGSRHRQGPRRERQHRRRRRQCLGALAAEPGAARRLGTEAAAEPGRHARRDPPVPARRAATPARCSRISASSPTRSTSRRAPT